METLEPLEFVVRAEAPWPKCTELFESREYWKQFISEQRQKGLEVLFWDEYQGARVHEEKPYKVYFAHAFLSRKPGARFIKAKNHFGQRAIYV
jgi:hypothetical protein